jgi:hypothetical protein
MSATGIALVLGIIAVVALVMFLFVKELAAATHKGHYVVFSKALDIGIIPLAITFGAILILEIMQFIG